MVHPAGFSGVLVRIQQSIGRPLHSHGRVGNRMVDSPDVQFLDEGWLLFSEVLAWGRRCVWLELWRCGWRECLCWHTRGADYRWSFIRKNFPGMRNPTLWALFHLFAICVLQVVVIAWFSSSSLAYMYRGTPLRSTYLVLRCSGCTCANLSVRVFLGSP